MMIMRFTASWSVVEIAVVSLLMVQRAETQGCPDCCPDSQQHKHTTYNSQTTVLRQVTPPLIVCTSPTRRTTFKCTHPPKQFKFTCPHTGKCNPYRFTSPIPCKCTPASTCAPTKNCTKMRPRCTCASRLASKISAHVARASIYAAKASSHAFIASSLAAEASSLAAEASDVSGPTSTTAYTTTPPRGGCGPHLVGEDVKHVTPQETGSVNGLPRSNRPWHPSTETEGFAVSTRSSSEFVTAAENAEPQTTSTVSQPPIKHTSWHTVETAAHVSTARFSEKLSVSFTATGPTTKSTKRIPKGNCGPRLAAEAADRTERQKTRSTGILPVAEHSNFITAENAEPVTGTVAPVRRTRVTKKVPEGKLGPYLAAEVTGRSAQPTFGSAKTLPEVKCGSRSTAETGYPTRIPTTISAKKGPESKSAADLVAGAADRAARPVSRSTGTQPEAAENASPYTAKTGYPPTLPASRLTKKIPLGKCGLYLSSEAAERAGRLANGSTGNSPEPKLTSRYTVQNRTPDMLPTVRSVRK